MAPPNISDSQQSRPSAAAAAGTNAALDAVHASMGFGAGLVAPDTDADYPSLDFLTDDLLMEGMDVPAVGIGPSAQVHAHLHALTHDAVAFAPHLVGAPPPQGGTQMATPVAMEEDHTAGTALPLGQAPRGLDTAILTHELWPRLVDLNMAIATLSTPAAPPVGGAAGDSNVGGASGDNSTIEALRHALLNRAAAAGGVGTLRTGTDPDLDEFMTGLVVAVSRYYDNLQAFYRQQEAALRGFDTRLAEIAQDDEGLLQQASDERAAIGTTAVAGGAGGVGIASSTAAAAAMAGVAGPAASTPDLAILKDTPQFREELKRNYRKELLEWKAKFAVKRRKGKLPDASAQVLKAYWDANQEKPYPTEAEKATLCKKSALTKTQVDNWLINMRKRHWKGGDGGGPSKFAKR